MEDNQGRHAVEECYELYTLELAYRFLEDNERSQGIHDELEKKLERCSNSVQIQTAFENDHKSFCLLALKKGEELAGDCRQLCSIAGLCFLIQPAEEGCRILQKAESQAHEFDDYYHIACTYLSFAGEKDQALKWFIKSEEYASHCFDFICLAEKLIELGKQDYAMKLIKKAEGMEKSIYEIKKIFDAYLSVGNRRAIIHLSNRCMDELVVPDQLCDLSSFLVEIKFPDQALQMVERAMELFSESSLFITGSFDLCQFAEVFARLNYKTKALKIIEQAKKNAVDSFDMVIIAETYDQLGYQDKAYSLIEKEIEKATDSTDLMWIGKFYRKRDKEKCTSYFIKSEEQATNASDLLWLAQDYILDYNNKEYAKMLLKKAREIGVEDSDMEMYNRLQENLDH